MGSKRIVPVGLALVSSSVLSSLSSVGGVAAFFGRYLSASASKSTSGSSSNGLYLMGLRGGSKLSKSEGCACCCCSAGDGDLRLAESKSTGNLLLSAKSESVSESVSESSVLPDCGSIFLTGFALATSIFLGGLHCTRSARYFSALGFGSATRTHCPLRSFHCFWSS